MVLSLAKYALHDLEVTDLFGVRGRQLLRQHCELLRLTRRMPPGNSSTRSKVSTAR
jgi:hypothetical protein